MPCPKCCCRRREGTSSWGEIFNPCWCLRPINPFLPTVPQLYLTEDGVFYGLLVRRTPQHLGFQDAT